MKLYDNWREILKRSWNLRLVFIIGIMSGGELIMPIIADYLPRPLFAGLSFVFCAGAVMARLVAQKGI